MAYFVRLGLIGFGGPPAHIAIMRRELVEQRGWIDDDQFGADLATANLLPGPTSTEMTIYIGYRLHGAVGAVAAGSMFILPAFVLVLLIAMAYVALGNVAWMQSLLYAIKPVALALVIAGVLQLGKSVRSDWRETVVFAAALSALLLTPVDVLLLFVLCGLLYLALKHLLRLGASTALLLPLNAYANSTGAAAPDLLSVLWVFLKIGALIYGGGFALVGILQQMLVADLGWLTQQQLLDGIAIGQSTPGPVFTTATFVGYLVGGLPGAVLATIGIFAPAFVFVLAESTLLKSLKQSALFRDFLKGVNAAVVASLVLAAGQLGRSALIDPLTLLLCAAAFVALVWKKVDAHWLVGAGLLIGVSRLALS